MSESAFAVYSQKKKKSKKRKLIKQPSVASSNTQILSNSGETTNGIPETHHSKEMPSTANPKLLKKSKVKDDTSDVNNSIALLSEIEVTPKDNPKVLFEWMLNPMKSNQFFESYWENQILHIERFQPEYYSSLLTSSDIDTMLRENPLYFGRNVDIVKYIDGIKLDETPVMRAQSSIVWDAYAQGYSVRILNPQTYNNKVHLILATLQEYFGTMVGANVYLTPAGSQGFAPHFDDIEAFIIQLEGKKYWKVYKPLNEVDNLARFSSKDFGRDQLGELLYEIELKAGDMLYFPRGFVHEAKTGPDEHSLHITISTYQRTSYADLLHEILPQALQDAVNNDIDYRRGLPIHYLKHIGFTNNAKQTPERIQIIKNAQKLFLKMAQYLDVDEAGDKLGRKFMHDAMPPILSLTEQQCSSVYDGSVLQNGKLINRSQVTMDSAIRLCRYYACRFVKENDQAMLYFSTHNANVYHDEDEHFLSVEMEMGTVIELLFLQYPEFTKLSQFGFENEEKQARLIDFVTQLWDYGIIITRKPLELVE